MLVAVNIIGNMVQLVEKTGLAWEYYLMNYGSSGDTVFHLKMNDGSLHEVSLDKFEPIYQENTMLLRAKLREIMQLDSSLTTTTTRTDGTSTTPSMGDTTLDLTEINRLSQIALKEVLLWGVKNDIL